MAEARKKASWRDFGFGTVDGHRPNLRQSEFEKACRRIGAMPEAAVIKRYLADMIAADIPPDEEDGALRQHLAERRVAQKLALLFAGDDDNGNGNSER